ncbi:hypothetical protein NDU88_011548 [Pleurodeles waltl]|uniref:Uncharacterized protein n=1 Tax=Pleurodeles waltl TaxID=8319 RepID=A0AAV7S575_PLEWA|nr:hypothetical protein NDU88_011548 [Pleurodeles waltl]
MLAVPGPSPAAPSVPPTPLAGACSEVNNKAARRPRRKLITSFYQKVDKAPLLQQTIEEEKEKEKLGCRGVPWRKMITIMSTMTGLMGMEIHMNASSERASEKRTVKSTAFTLARPLEIMPVDEEVKVTEEQTRSKSCPTPKSQLSVLGSPCRRGWGVGPGYHREGRPVMLYSSPHFTAALLVN